MRKFQPAVEVRPGPRVRMNTIRINKSGLARITWAAISVKMSLCPVLSGGKRILNLVVVPPGMVGSRRLWYANKKAKSPLLLLRGFLRAHDLDLKAVAGVYPFAVKKFGKKSQMLVVDLKKKESR
jgi:hypothetical protein